MDEVITWKVILSEIIWRLQVQFQQQVRIEKEEYLV